MKESHIMANASYYGECLDSNYKPAITTAYLAMIPFYGGLPPNVTDGLLVKSIGQGNSLVSSY